MKHILLLENDQTLAQLIVKHLQAKNYFVQHVARISSAIKELENFSYDLVILDRVVDDGDGIEVAEFITDFSYQTKVIILSELNKTHERVAGLEKGADDYLCKPFSLTELSIKIQKLLQTQKIKSAEELTLANLKILAESGEVIMGTTPYQRRKKEIQLLSCLVRHKNQVVSREKIIDIVWSGSYEVPTQSTLDVYVRRLRVKLGKYKDLIKTVRGFGYMALELE